MAGCTPSGRPRPVKQAIEKALASGEARIFSIEFGIRMANGDGCDPVVIRALILREKSFAGTVVWKTFRSKNR